jgi:hypothetical protein
MKIFNFVEIFEIFWKFWNFLKILKFYEIFAIWLADWKWNLVSGWSVGKPEYTPRELYSLHARCTHSEVELRKCCLGQSEKKEIPYYLITILADLQLWKKHHPDIMNFKTKKEKTQPGIVNFKTKEVFSYLLVVIFRMHRVNIIV